MSEVDKANQPDAYSHYEDGLNQLLKRIKRDNPHYQEALVYQQRFIENIIQSRRHGDTDTRKAERSEIVDRLNNLALSTLNISFNELCAPLKPPARQERDAHSPGKEAQLRILEYLSDTDKTPREGLTERELSKHLNLQPRQIRRALSALGDSGYVEVTQLSEKWGQASLYRLTKTGFDAARSEHAAAIRGDVIIALVGDHAQNVVVGKDIHTTNASTEKKDVSEASDS